MKDKNIIKIPDETDFLHIKSLAVKNINEILNSNDTSVSKAWTFAVIEYFSSLGYVFIKEIKNGDS